MFPRLMTKLLAVACVVVFCFDGSLLFGHEGHGHGAMGAENSAAHYVTELPHVAQIVGLVAVAGCVVAVLMRRQFSNKSVGRDA